jgi:methylmalonyl-CoA/ethylmalonyl-CoA epimerase
MEFHHIGVATTSLKRSIIIYEKLGFQAGNVFHDDIQRVNICFMDKPGHPLIELIEPADEQSPVNKIIEKSGTSPYHFCYHTDDIIRDISLLKENRFIMVVSPVEAVAFGRKRICFCYNKDFGLLELIEN